MLKLQPKSLFVGQKQIYLPHCHSTNDVASGLSQNGTFTDGTLVITDYQSKGRGQRGTQWEGEPGKNLMMSLLLDTSFLDVARQFDLSLCAALGVHAALRSAGLANARVKWPNDLYAGNRKIGGILIENILRESRLRSSVVGIGINISQNTFGNLQASSLSLEGCTVDRDTLAEQVCFYFEQYYLRLQQGDDLRREYLPVLLGLNEEREYISGDTKFTGIIRGISETGQLIVESELPRKNFDIKEISFCF
ncbi:biotin--[acetyl-CoA-carboxylase] ligase [Leadbetterella sp. DM7]|uniref:biotin--[acetyl-CoA-carboxylase] ligase n=1 Tax=Leadbetterella sp. DM7 TaxID=3235085 RepID=UPI00349EE03C